MIDIIIFYLKNIHAKFMLIEITLAKRVGIVNLINLMKQMNIITIITMNEQMNKYIIMKFNYIILNINYYMYYEDDYM